MENHNQTVTWKVIDDKFESLDRLIDEKFKGIEDRYPNRTEFRGLIKEIQDDIHKLELAEARRAARTAIIWALIAMLISIAGVIWNGWRR